MNRNEILAALNAEIDHLTAVRDLMSSGSQTEAPRRRGRPKGSQSKATSFSPEEFVTKKTHTMSADGKARIAEAQRKRWAAQRKSAKVKTTPARKAAPATKKATKPAVRPAPKTTPAKRAPKPAQTKATTPA